MKQIRISHLRAAGLRGRSFEHDLEPVCVFTGANGAGKSTRLVALDLALRGPQRNDVRYGEPAVCSVGVVVDHGDEQTTVDRDICPKHNLSLGGRRASLKDAQSDLDRLVGGVSQVFDLGEFLGLSAKEQIKRLLELSAHVPAAEVSDLWPEVVPVRGESAQAWLARAREALRTERLALEQLARDEAKTAVTLVGDTRGRSMDPAPLRAELEEVERELRQLGLRDVELAQLRGTQAELDAARAKHQALSEQMDQRCAAVVPEFDEAAYEQARKRLAAAQTAEMDAHRAARDVKEAQETIDRARRQHGSLERATLPARSALVVLLAAAHAGDHEEVARAWQAALEQLGRTGWPVGEQVVQELAAAEARLAKAKQVPAFDPRELTEAHAAVQQLQYARDNRDKLAAEAAAYQKWATATFAEMEALDLTIGQREAVVATLVKRVAAMPEPGAERLAELQERQRNLRQRLEQAVSDGAVRAREVELQKKVAERGERLQTIKAQEQVLADRAALLLRQSLTPITNAIQPFIDEIGGGPFELGPDSAPLGIRRGELWIPLGALSDSEQGVLTTGLALALQTAKRQGMRLLMLDRLDVCDERRQEAILSLAVRLVSTLQLDQFIATTHMSPKTAQVQVIRVAS